MPDSGGDHDAFGPAAQLVIAAVLIGILAYLLVPIIRTGSL